MDSKQLLPIILFIITVSGCCGSDCERRKYAEDIIQKVETYTMANGHLPADIEAIEILEQQAAQVFYVLNTDTTYLVWYANGFESMVYSSVTKKWREEG